MSPTEEKRWIEVAPSRGWRGIDLKELWEYHELLYIFAWRDVKVRYRQTILGVAWVLAQPVITVVIFTLLFNRVARIEADVAAPYPVFVMAALVPWTLFSSGVLSSGNSLIGSAHLISKVYFPRMIVPAAAITSGLIDLVVTVGAVFGMMIFTGTSVRWSALLLPLPILVCLLLTLAVGLWLSALNVEYRDVRVVIPILMQFWLYATPVVYPLGALPVKVQLAALLNPMTGVVNFFRNALIGAPLDWAGLGYSAVFGIVALVSGAFYFRRMERLFADIL